MTSNINIRNRFKHLLPSLILTVPLLLVALVMAWQLEINPYLIAFCFSSYFLVAILAFYHLSSKHQQQMSILSDLLDALIDGDYTLRGKDLYSAHFQSLLERVNQLGKTLQNQTLALQEKQKLIQQVIDHMDAAVLAIDDAGTVVFSNRAAHILIGQPNRLPPALFNALKETPSGKSLQLKATWCADMHPGGEYLLRYDRFIAQGKSNQLVVLSEVGQLLHHNEAIAWQRLVRVISHEINNSMSPVNTISRTMLRQSVQNDLPQNFVQGLEVIQERCEHMIDFIASFRKISQLPEPNKQPVELAELLNKCLALFHHREIVLSGNCNCQVYCDQGQIQQVLINLLKNADEAMVQNKDPVKVAVDATDKQVKILIIDHGSGIANSENLFVPFYSTKSGGSGIGLMLSGQIINNHHGQLTLTNRTDGQGATATIILPV